MDFNISNLGAALFQTNKAADTQKTNGTTAKQEFSVSPSNKEFLLNMNSKQIENLYAQVTNAATNIMNNMQQNIFLRDMMGLPKDWASLLNEFAYSQDAQIAAMLKSLNAAGKNSMQDALLALLSSNSRVNLSALAELLNKNAALMSDKLLKYMGNMNMAQNNIAQLKSLMTIGASISGLAQTNPNEFIRDIIQMYVPWLPLVPPKEEDLAEIQAQMSGSSNGDAQISFFISTDFLGYFKIEIVSGDECEIYINNVCEKENDELNKALVDNLKDAIKRASMKAKLYYSSKADKDELTKKGKQLYIVNSNDSTVGLMLIQLLSKTIFEFDDTQGQRFTKLNSSDD